MITSIGATSTEETIRRYMRTFIVIRHSDYTEIKLKRGIGNLLLAEIPRQNRPGNKWYIRFTDNVTMKDIRRRAFCSRFHMERLAIRKLDRYLECMGKAAIKLRNHSND